MSKRYYGNEGVIGRINSDLTVDLALKLGKAIGLYLHESGCSNKVIIGQDSKNSSNIIVNIIASAIAAFGIDVEKVGIVPKPVLVFLTKHLDCSLGVLVSSSNIDQDFGCIKIYKGEEVKQDLATAVENFISNQDFVDRRLCLVKEFGSVRNHTYNEIYVEYMNKTFNIKKNKLKIAVDFVNGAASVVFKEILERYFDIMPINYRPNGYNLTKPNKLHMRGLIDDNRLDFGIIFDSDGSSMTIIGKKDHEIKKNNIIHLFLSIVNGIKKVNIIGELSKYIWEEIYNQEIKISRDADIVIVNSIKMIFKKHVDEEDGLFMLLKMCESLINREIKIDDVIDKLPQNFRIMMGIKISQKYRERYEDSSDIEYFLESLEAKLEEGEKMDVSLPEGENCIRIVSEAHDKKRAYDIAYMIASFIEKELKYDQV